MRDPVKSIGVIVPVFNEYESLEILFEQVKTVITSNYQVPFRVYFIDDGSNDGSDKVISKLAQKFPENIVSLKLRRNFGKSTALAVGFDKVQEEYIFTMDADLQDDPSEIPHFITKLNEGYDLVSGWKKKRYDPFSKTLPSKLFNYVTSKVTGVKLHDFNCGFKLYRKQVVKSLDIYGEMHRFTPALANFLGFRIGELVVNHHSRKFGKSKYGFERFLRGFLDLITVVATTKFLKRPAHLFGGAGVAFGFVGFVTLAYLSILKFLTRAMIGHRPLLLLGILLVVLSIQLISLGIIAELLVRNSRKESNDHYIDSNP